MQCVHVVYHQIGHIYYILVARSTRSNPHGIITATDEGGSAAHVKIVNVVSNTPITIGILII